jgi:hypothetical protein
MSLRSLALLKCDGRRTEKAEPPGVDRGRRAWSLETSQARPANRSAESCGVGITGPAVVRLLGPDTCVIARRQARVTAKRRSLGRSCRGHVERPRCVDRGVIAPSVSRLAPLVVRWGPSVAVFPCLLVDLVEVNPRHSLHC